MTNTLKLSFLSAALFALTATTGFAQSSNHVTVNVPFEFTAGNITLPAGVYNFHEDHTGIVTISSLNTSKSVMVLTNADTNSNEEDQPRVKFDKVNGVYALTQVAITGEPARKIVRAELASNRRNSIATRASAAATSKSLQ